MKTQNKITKVLNKLLNILIGMSILIFISSAGFRDSRISGWYQQWFPDLNGSQISSMTFLDSLTGFAVTNKNSNDQSYILKTTNGGDNWIIQIVTYPDFTKIAFANDSIGYASCYSNATFKTTNGGENWFALINDIYANDMAVINTDTILLVNDNALIGGIYRTTNGGLNWQLLYNGWYDNPYRIYMFDKNMGFIYQNGTMKKTTNGGVNWFIIEGEIFQVIHFVDTLTGWKTYGRNIISKTTDGGLSWIAQQLPNIHPSYIYTCVFALNKDTAWMIGNTSYFGLLYKTTNGGLNWGYQFADTSLHIILCNYIQFSSSKVGWALAPFDSSDVHTKTGGNDTTIFTSVNSNNTNISDDYILEQNYPNPFNNSTIINYTLKAKGFVKLIVYDILGKEIVKLINEEQKAGTYKIPFSINNLPSGIYFYRMETPKYVETKRMVVVK